MKMTIKVETVQHGFALTVGEKQWLLESELELAEAVAFRVGMGCTKPLSKKRVHMMLKALAYGNYNKKR